MPTPVAHPSKRVAIIGAGPAGIAALKASLDVGLDALAFDRNNEVGGNWLYSETDGHSSVFETTHIISSKTLSEYADFSWEDFELESGRSVPDYPSHEELAAYFQAYAKRFGLYDRIEFATEVVHVRRVGDQHWEMDLERAGIRRTETFSALIVCNGHHWDPRWPDYPGEFDGDFLHSHHFKKAEPFRGKRVLVIGGGNSACDVAVETSRVSDRTELSWRRGYRIIPKFVFGKPTDVFAARTSRLPIRLRTMLSAWLVRWLIGPNKAYGLPEPDHAVGETHPTVNDELLYRIRHGKIKPKPDIERFDGKRVHFADGSSAEFDCIIACTGFKISFPFIDSELIDYSEGAVPLYLKMMHPRYKHLFFVGLFQPLGCIWPLAELQAKIIARQLTGEWKRPAHIESRIQRELDRPHYRQVDSPRHSITVDYHVFRKQLLRELPRDYRKKEQRRQPERSALS